MAEGTISYVVLCHTGASQVLRLASTIRAMSPRSRVLIRHNQPPGFIDPLMAETCGADVLVSDIECRWGHWSLVEAALEAFNRAVDLHDPDWVVLISGQDYPIKPLGPWETSLLSDEYDAVMPGETLVTGRFGMTPGVNAERLKMRYTHRWYWLPRVNVLPRLPPRLTRTVRRVWFKFLYPLQAILVLNQLPRDEGWVLGIRRRTVPWSRAVPVYKGSQWIALSRRALATCADGARAERLRGYFVRTLVPDEAYFQTVASSAGDLRIRREPITWVRWESEVSPHPDVVDEASLALAIRAGTTFARKFDESVTPGILDYVDRTLLSSAVAR